MKTELARWSKPPIILNQELLSKNKLKPLEKAWVYNTVLAEVAVLPFLILSWLWMSLPFTMQTQAHESFIFWMVLGVVFTVVNILRAFGEDDPIGKVTTSTKKDRYGYNNGQVETKIEQPIMLSFRGRSQLCLYDRNRRRAHNNMMRRERYAEIDYRYPHYSVWPTAMGSGIQLKMLEHRPRGKSFYSRLTPWDVHPVFRNGTQAVDFLDSPTFEEMTTKQAQMEELANGLEEQEYAKALTNVQMQRDALMLRR